VVVEGTLVLGVIQLKDIVKGGIKERFAELRRMGIKTVMITGDNPLTAASIAAEAGVDDFLAQATPETKLKLIRDYQTGGRLVAIVGQQPMMRATLFTRVAGTQFKREELFDTVAPRLQGFPEPPPFRF